MDSLIIIGRAERVSFPSMELFNIPVKIDTGADASSIWCSKVEVVNDGLNCIFFGPQSKHYNGKPYHFKKDEVSLTRVANSFGQKEYRYKVKIPMKLKGKTIKATFTISDRSQKLYPVLIGRSTLRGKFLVDVRNGRPLRDEEKLRAAKMRQEITELKKGKK